MVQLDTLDIRPLPGVVVKHFTAHDVISQWNVLSVHSRAIANTGAHFLDILESRMPFPVKAIKVDGGSEFEAIFEEECQKRGIRLFALPPRSPKLNGGVERVHRIHTEEFYEVTESSCLASPRRKREKMAYLLRQLLDIEYREKCRAEAIRKVRSLVRENPKFLVYSVAALERMKRRLWSKIQ
ncbi:hypothetical protein ACFLVW_04685 [Chloroflexota bacterium]